MSPQSFVILQLVHIGINSHFVVVALLPYIVLFLRERELHHSQCISQSSRIEDTA